MKGTRYLVAVIGLVCSGSTISAPEPHCEQFTGTMTLQADDCSAFQNRIQRERIFQDADFYGLPGTCFYSTISDGELTDWRGRQQKVKGEGWSALTRSRFDPPNSPPSPGLFTAATIVDLRTDDAKQRDLGSIYLRDAGVGPDSQFVTAEQLIGVGGTRELSNRTVTLEIRGNEFIGAPVLGTICR